MKEMEPTPREALAALTEASDWPSRVRRIDGQFGRILIVAAAFYLTVGVLAGVSDLGGRTFTVLAFLVVVAGGLLATLLLLVRIRAYSRSGQLWFSASALGFTVWNAAVAGASSTSGWWGPTQPASHFTVSALIGAVPLVMAAWLIGRRA